MNDDSTLNDDNLQRAKFNWSKLLNKKKFSRHLRKIFQNLFLAKNTNKVLKVNVMQVGTNRTLHFVANRFTVRKHRAEYYIELYALLRTHLVCLKKNLLLVDSRMIVFAK